MGELLEISFTFPTVIFTFLLIVVIGFWLISLIGLADIDILDGGDDTNSSGGLTGLLPVARSSRGVPVTIVLSLWIIFAWIACVAGTVAVQNLVDLDLPAVVFAVLVLIAASVLAWVVTLFTVAPLGRLYQTDDAPSRHDFVGKTCVIRTREVNHDFGQAEITSTDGSSAVIQVRQAHDDKDESKDLTTGSTALIFDYDTTGEYFLVSPFDLPLHNDKP